MSGHGTWREGARTMLAAALATTAALVGCEDGASPPAAGSGDASNLPDASLPGDDVALPSDAGPDTALPSDAGPDTALPSAGGSDAASGYTPDGGALAKLRGTPVTVLSSGIYAAASVPPDAGEGDELSDHYVEPSASVCTDSWIDFDCDGAFAFPPTCPEGQRIDYEAETACPVCVDAPEEEYACQYAQRRYLEFLDHNLRETCTNWCEEDGDCVGWEIEACGLTYAASLRGFVDEEPIAFAEAFDQANCGDCPENDGNAYRFLTEMDPVCRANQCVLVVAEEPSKAGPRRRE